MVQNRHSVVCLLVCSLGLLIHLLSPACFACVLCCADSSARTFTHSQICGKVMPPNDLVLSHSAFKQFRPHGIHEWPFFDKRVSFTQSKSFDGLPNTAFSANQRPSFFALATHRKFSSLNPIIAVKRLPKATAALWARSIKNPDVSTGPLARPFARSLAPLTR